MPTSGVYLRLCSHLRLLALGNQWILLLTVREKQQYFLKIFCKDRLGIQDNEAINMPEKEYVER